MGGSVKTPRIGTKNLIRFYLISLFLSLFSVLLCEAAAIYGLIISIVLSGKLGDFRNQANPGFIPAVTYHSGM